MKTPFRLSNFYDLLLQYQRYLSILFMAFGLLNLFLIFLKKNSFLTTFAFLVILIIQIFLFEKIIWSICLHFIKTKKKSCLNTLQSLKISYKQSFSYENIKFSLYLKKPSFNHPLMYFLPLTEDQVKTCFNSDRRSLFLFKFKIISKILRNPSFFKYTPSSFTIFQNIEDNRYYLCFKNVDLIVYGNEFQKIFAEHFFQTIQYDYVHTSNYNFDTSFNFFNDRHIFFSNLINQARCDKIHNSLSKSDKQVRTKRKI